VKTIQKLGLTLPIDGSCDDELSVKDIESYLLQIGDGTTDFCLRNLHLSPSGESPNTFHASTLRVGEASKDLGVEFIDREYRRSCNSGIIECHLISFFDIR